MKKNLGRRGGGADGASSLLYNVDNVGHGLTD